MLQVMANGGTLGTSLFTNVSVEQDFGKARMTVVTRPLLLLLIFPCSTATRTSCRRSRTMHLLSKQDASMAQLPRRQRQERVPLVLMEAFSIASLAKILQLSSLRTISSPLQDYTAPGHSYQSQMAISYLSGRLFSFRRRRSMASICYLG